MLAALGAAGLCLALAVVGTFVARDNLVEAQSWVRHTSEVELAIAECRIRLRDAGVITSPREASMVRAKAAAERVRALTIDNPAQQTRITDLVARLHAYDGSSAAAASIDGVLRELTAVESSLMDVRTTALARATRAGWLVLDVSATLTLLMIGVFVTLLHRQTESLARTQVNLRQKSAMLGAIVEGMVDGVMAITPDRKVLQYNRAAYRLLGDRFSRESFPKDWSELIECVYEDGTRMKPEEGALARAIAGHGTDNLVYRARQVGVPDDTGTWISATGRPVLDSDGTLVAGMVVLRDISEQRRHQDELRALSISDELTGLHNRRGFLVLAEQHARVARRQRAPFAVAFADLNGLKTVNDTLGHDAGDRMIRSAADVLRDVFRGSDIIARLGGDEFVALLVNVGPDQRETIISRIDATLAKHNTTSAATTPLSFSLGLSFFDPEQPATLPDLMANADRLMYENKREQRGKRG